MGLNLMKFCFGDVQVPLLSNITNRHRLYEIHQTLFPVPEKLISKHAR